jgi:hypothetical protein
VTKIRSALVKRSGVGDRAHKDSLEVINLSLLRKLTPKPVQERERERERKEGRHMQFLKDSNSEAGQNKTPALFGGE